MYRANSANASSTDEMIPITMPGVIPPNGNMKPVTLVSTVVSRKSAVQAGSGFPSIIPITTMKPVTIATRLMTTCNGVNA